MTRARCSVQVEEEEKVPDREAELAVVATRRVPETVAVVPDAVLVKEKDADPVPPATWSSSPSLSSIVISVMH